MLLDPETYEVERVVAAHDVGRAVNPLLCEGQIEGAVHMGLGCALTEGFPTDSLGRPLNTTLRSLDIIRPKDMPPVDVIIVESPERSSPWDKRRWRNWACTHCRRSRRRHSLNGSRMANRIADSNTANRERADAWR